MNRIFEGVGVLYQIPDYQRPYSWERKHIEQLWDDLLDAWSGELGPQSDEPYFLGSIILIDGDGERRDILDGQQRLTTLTIFYAVLRDCFDDELRDHHLETIGRRIKDTSTGDPRYRLRTGERHQDEFETAILSGIDFERDNNYTRAAETTRDWIETNFQAPKELNEFFEFIERQVELVQIESSELSYAIRVFQTINTRGKDLTVSDLTKSFLLSAATTDEDRETVAETWKKLVGRFDEEYDEVDKLLRSYRLYLQATKAQQTVYEELKGEFETSFRDGISPVEAISDIDRYARAYQKVQSLSWKPIYALRNLRHSLYWKTILAAAEKEGSPKIRDLAEELVALYYSYWVAGHTSEKIKSPSYTLVKKIRDEESISSIREYIDQKRGKDNISQKVRDSLHSDVYGERWHRALLIAIEYKLTADKKIRRIKPGRDLHCEHILPKKYEAAMKAEDYWAEKFDPEEAAKLRHSLGNLTPLEQEIHEWVLTKPYPVKADYYVGRVHKLPETLSDREATSFDLTRRVVDHYEDWTPEAVRSFRDFLVGQTAEILRLDGDRLRPDPDNSSEM